MNLSRSPGGSWNASERDRNRQAEIERDVAAADADEREPGLRSGEHLGPDLQRGPEGVAAGRSLAGKRRHPLVEAGVVADVAARAKDAMRLRRLWQRATQDWRDPIEEDASAGAQDDPAAPIHDEIPGHELRRGGMDELQEGVHRAENLGRELRADAAFKSGHSDDSNAGARCRGLGNGHHLVDASGSRSGHP